MDLGAGLAAATNAVAITKSLRNIEKNYDLAHLKAQIAQLYESQSDAKMALVDAKEKILELEAEIARLKAVQEERPPLKTCDGGYKYFPNDAGNPEGFPVCPKCEQEGHKLVQLVQNVDVNAAKCPVCSSEFAPVTCYLKNGGTLLEQRNEEQRRRSDEANRKMLQASGKDSWMV